MADSPAETQSRREAAPSAKRLANSKKQFLANRGRNSTMEYRLDELGLVKRGRSKHRPRNAPELYDGDYPFVQTGDIKAAGLHLFNYKQTYNKLKTQPF